MASVAADLELNGAQLKALQDALMSAFPSRFGFEQLARFRFDVNLNEIAKEATSLEQVAFEMIGWAMASGQVAKLIACARAENDGNPELKAFGTTLEETIAELDVVTAHRSFDGKPRWIADLRDARARVSAALEEGNVEPLKAAVAMLDRVLAIQPTRINTRLNDSARTLRLRDLVANLRHIHEQLRTAALDPAKVAEFATGIASLEQLDLALRQLVTEHDRWQELGVELRLERNALLIGPDGLKTSWPRLETQLLPLCGGGEPWSVKLTDECRKLSAALVAIDVSVQRSAFLQVHSQAATRFYQVDISLHRLCESLREIGNPLTELLRRLQ